MNKQVFIFTTNAIKMSKEDELEYYDKRIIELDKLLAHAKSQTLIDLITKAKKSTEENINKLITVQKAIILYLKNYQIRDDEFLAKFTEQISLCSIEVKKIKETEAPKDAKLAALSVYENLADEFDKKITQRKELQELTYKVFISCANEFKRVLLEMIFKPNTSQFHYESIIEVLNYIASRFIPGLEEIKTISSFPIAIRRKQFAKSGDKVLIYLEQYIDVLEKWNILADKLIEVTEN